MKIEPYRNREVRGDESVWVYRNLMRKDGPWYSLSQRGCVVAHGREVHLRDVTFHVRPGGLARFKRTGVKNVHAFVVGHLALREVTYPVEGGDINGPIAGRYLPHGAGVFEAQGSDGWYPIRYAKSACLNASGLRLWGVMFR